MNQYSLDSILTVTLCEVVLFESVQCVLHVTCKFFQVNQSISHVGSHKLLYRETFSSLQIRSKENRVYT